MQDTAEKRFDTFPFMKALRLSDPDHEIYGRRRVAQSPTHVYSKHFTTN